MTTDTIARDPAASAATELIVSLTTGTIDPTAYDTAWVVRAAMARPSPLNAPASIARLRAQQRADGSWGGAARHWHDRLVSTGSALLAFAAAGVAPGDPSIAAALRFLHEALPRIREDAYELVCSELLLPVILDDLEGHGWHVGPHAGLYREERELKLELARRLPLFSPRNQTSHSLEFLGPTAAFHDLARALSPNGSLGNSPAATAYLLTLGAVDAAYEYLLTYLNDGAITTLAPWENFEHQYVLYQLFKAGLNVRGAAAAIFERIHRTWTSEGLSLAPTFLAPDGDDTALAIYLSRQFLTRRGDRVLNPQALQRYERDGFFTTYPEERNGSLLVNLHAIDALQAAPDYPNRDAVLRRAVGHVLAWQRPQGYWDDKWHISRTFIAAQAILALTPLTVHPTLGPAVTDALLRAAGYLAAAQDDDGRWDTNGQPTQEDTASAVQGLAYLRLAGVPVPRDVLGRGLAALERLEPDHVPLWVAKCLFYPPHIVAATVLSARVLAARALRLDGD